MDCSGHGVIGEAHQAKDRWHGCRRRILERPLLDIKCLDTGSVEDPVVAGADNLVSSVTGLENFS